MMNRKIVKGTSPDCDKILAIYEELLDGTYKLFCGDTLDYQILSKEELRKIRIFPRTSKYMLIQHDKSLKRENLIKLDMKEQYEIIYKEAVYLKELTNGKINRFRTGTVAKTAMQLFYDLCPEQYDELTDTSTEPDPIDFKESEIIESCYPGALIWGIPYEGVGYKYDVVSEYASIMISKALKFPIGKGNIFTMTTEEFESKEFLQYGIYHVEIYDADYRLFRTNTNRDHWYTHTDLNYAKNKLGYKLKIIQDGSDNAMIYTKLRLASKIFGPVIDYLFQFKKLGIKEIKKYITALWGALCQTNKLTTETKIVRSNQRVYSIQPINAEGTRFTTTLIQTDKPLFETNYARMKPFITAAGRLKISNMIRPNLENCVRCHTDGIISRKQIKDVELGTDIGQLKYEGMGYCTINNSNTYKFDDSKRMVTIIKGIQLIKQIDTLKDKTIYKSIK